MLSIIIPVLNEESNIEAALNRLEPQIERFDIEVIVVDGGSSDRTVEFVRDRLWARLVECERANRGFQLNKGAAESNGEILVFLHADVCLPGGAINSIQETAGDRCNSGISGGCFQISFPKGSPRSLRLVAGGINFRTRLFRTATGDQTIFVRREIFKAIGGFREIPLMEDIVFFNELKKRVDVRVLDDRVEISARRWLKHGVWKTVILMYVLRFGHWIGISPFRLKRYFVDVR